MLTLEILGVVVMAIVAVELLRIRYPTVRAPAWLAFAAGLIISLFVIWATSARDMGQWEASDPEVRAWYQALMQPDVPTMSCCGEADAYWCDITRTEVTGDGPPKNFCLITDDRPDAPLGRPHREIGSEFEIPNHKLKYDRGNPTGHAIIFLSREDYVYCYVAPGGV